MDFLMCIEAWALLVTFATHYTLIGFLICVSSLMRMKVGILLKGFSTYITLIGFLTRMSSLMYSEV